MGTAVAYSCSRCAAVNPGAAAYLFLAGLLSLLGNSNYFFYCISFWFSGRSPEDASSGEWGSSCFSCFSSDFSVFSGFDEDD